MYIFIVYNPIQFNIHYLSSFYHFIQSPRYSILFFHTKILSKFLPSFSQNRTKFTSNNVKTNQTLLSTQEPNKKKKKKKPRRRRRRRRVTRHVLRHLEKRRWCVETEKNPRGIPQGKRVAGSQGWHVPPRQNGRAKPV